MPLSKKRKVEHQHQEHQVCGQVRSQQVPSAKSIEKLISQNFKIISKLDILISAQQSVDDRLKRIKGSSDETSNEEVIKTIVIEVVRNLLKVSIYPSQNEFCEEIEKVLRSSFPELHKKFRQSPIFYEKIYINHSS